MRRIGLHDTCRPTSVGNTMVVVRSTLVVPTNTATLKSYVPGGNRRRRQARDLQQPSIGAGLVERHRNLGELLPALQNLQTWPWAPFRRRYHERQAEVESPASSPC